MHPHSSSTKHTYLVGSIQSVLDCESVCLVLFWVTAISRSQSQNLIHPP